MISTCEYCGYSTDIQNFNTIMNTATLPNGYTMRTIYIECPICLTQIYMNNFEDAKNSSVVLKYGKIYLPNDNAPIKEKAEHRAKKLVEERTKLETSYLNVDKKFWNKLKKSNKSEGDNV